MNLYELTIIKPRAKKRKLVIPARSYKELEKKSLRPLFKAQESIKRIEVRKVEKRHGGGHVDLRGPVRHYYSDLSCDKL